MHRFSCVLMAFVFATPSLFAQTPITLDVWPDKVPGELISIGDEKFVPPNSPKSLAQKLLTNVSKPAITFHPAPKDKANGATVVVCPGGGYNILAIDLEGAEVVEWLNSIGVNAVLLKYRVPRRKDLPPYWAPLQDAQRTMSLVRSKASEWNLDPKRIGILGFSAGGHLSAATSNNFEKRNYKATDDIDKESCRPDFCVMIYPAYLVTRDGGLSRELMVSAKTPPTFLAHAANDPIIPDNSIFYFQTLRKLGVQGELHIYGTGGHGFGLRASDQPCSTWPKRCEEWMRTMGFLTKQSVSAEPPR